MASVTFKKKIVLIFIYDCKANHIYFCAFPKKEASFSVVNLYKAKGYLEYCKHECFEITI